jgi:hypothetical protein
MNSGEGQREEIYSNMAAQEEQLKEFSDQVYLWGTNISFKFK